MDFAPYQSSPPETTRALSPQTSPRHSADFVRRSFSPTQANIGSRPSPPPLQHPQPQRHWGGSSLAHEYRNPSAGGDYDGDLEAGRGGGLLGGLSGGGMVSEFDTSLGIRLDYEAAAAYLALPPLGPIVLLILERKSDYVRFHAWQSSILFTIILIIHLIFSWSSFLSWFFFIGDLVLMAWLAMRAYRDTDTLDRFEVPFIGPVASRIVDDE